MKMLLVVGRDPDDVAAGIDGVIIAGAIDYGIYEIIDADEAEKWIKKLKDSVTMDGMSVEWREVTVNIDEKILQSLFDTPEITAEVES